MCQSKMPRGVDLTVELRDLIISKFKDGIRQSKIARQINRHRSVVSKTISRYRVRNSILSRPKSGRPRITNKATDRKIKMLSTQDPFLPATEIKKELPQTGVSVRTIRRRLNEIGLYGRRPAHKPLISKRNRLARIKFAQDHLNWTVQRWRTVLFSDESKFNLFGSDGMKWVRRPKDTRFDPKYTRATVKHGGGNIMVWGCFSGCGMGPLIKIEGKMDRFQYLRILQEHMLPYAEENMPLQWRFQQDNDPKHTARLVKRWVQESNIPLMEWPAQSPDLNPIENVWDHLERKIRQKTTEKFQNQDALFRALQKEWLAISQDYRDSLMKSMRSRCAEVIKRRGFSTHY